MPKINYITGDLFSHKSLTSTVLAHACNCRGSWGAGVAAVFRKHFPSAYDRYVDHCRKHSANPAGLLGSTYLIKSDSGDPGNFEKPLAAYVACMFTSDAFGRRKDVPDDILENTRQSMEDLDKQLASLVDQGESIEQKDGVCVVNMPKINAGLFSVPWEETAAVLEGENASSVKDNFHEKRSHINVYVL